MSAGPGKWMFVTYLVLSRCYGKETACTYSSEVTSVIELQPNIPSKPDVVVRLPNEEQNEVALSLRIKADSRRVYHALSIPEYMEAWMQAPDRDKLLFVSGLAEQENFRIYLYRARSLHGSIHGSTRVTNENRITYIWRTKSPVGTARTRVDISLVGSRRGCTLRLKHSGLQNMADREWHRTMWCRSMERLSLLIGAN